MPKCQVDSVLQDHVHCFVRENRLTVNGAAKLLGVNRTTFWRFHETGEALSSTRDRIREAITNRSKHTAARVADEAVIAGASGHQDRAMQQWVLADLEIKQIRKVCESVLALLTFYESQSLQVRKI